MPRCDFVIDLEKKKKIIEIKFQLNVDRVNDDFIIVILILSELIKRNS
jgi:hypothetical protein